MNISYMYHTRYINQFISCSVRGVFSSVFCDFGPEFTILDNNGEEPVECFIGNISKVTTWIHKSDSSPLNDADQ